MTDQVLLTLGHGYSAARLAASLPAGWRVLGTTRSAAKAEAMRMAGFEPVAWDAAGAVDAAIAAAGHLLVSLAPDADGDPVLARHAAALAAARPRWVGYLSTTGVYGDRQGGWVDETSPLAPVNDRGRWRVAAEAAWLASGLPVHVFRLAGIYGPGRSAFDRLREGRAQRIVRPGQVFSRIHVDDLAAVLRASMAQPRPGRVYNVADDAPAPPQQVVVHAAALLGVPPPPEVAFEDADLSPMARSFYAESKRVANRRIREELGVELAYPDYRAGLAAILASGG
jgi:nucleoside-diphosphate-sugar epimerase